MLSFKIKHLNNKLLSWLAILTLAAYPISASLSIFLKTPSTPINFGYRFIIVLLSLYFLIKNNLIFRQRLSLINQLFLLFWGIYIIRLFYDLTIRGIHLGSYGTFTIFSFAIGNCLLPFIALALGAKQIQPKYFIRYYFLTVFVSNILIITSVIIQNQGINIAMFLNRVSIVGVEDENALVINTILISYYGELLLVFTTYLIFVKSSLFKKPFLYVSIIIGIFNLILGASRGPMLGALLCMFFLCYAFFPKKLKIKKSTIYGVVISLGLFIILLNNARWQDKFTAFRRLGIFLDDANSNNRVKEGRDYEWEAAWNQFSKNPFLGDKITNDYDQYYTHNIYLEVLQSVGLLGGIPFFLGLTILSFLMLKYKKEPFAYIFLPNAIFGLTSGSLYFNVGFWVSMALLGVFIKSKDSILEISNQNT